MTLSCFIMVFHMCEIAHAYEDVGLLYAYQPLHAWINSDMQIHSVKDESLVSWKFICSTDGFYKVSLQQVWSQECSKRGKWLSQDDMFRKDRKLQNLQSVADNNNFTVCWLNADISGVLRSLCFYWKDNKILEQFLDFWKAHHLYLYLFIILNFMRLYTS